MGSGDPGRRHIPPVGARRQGQVYTTSRNGRFVVYSWVATDESTSGMLLWDITIDAVSDLPDSLGHPIGISDDGRFITSTDSSGALQLDRQTGFLERAPGSRDAVGASGDGKFVYTFPRGTPANPNPDETLARWDTRSNRIDDFSSLGSYPLPGACDIRLGLRVTDDGSVCWGTRDALDAIDTNGSEDIYLVN